MTGTIFDIKRFAVHDGPGIRTTVFLKGCPLRCAWCHNPESQGFGVETLAGRAGPVVVGREVTVDAVVRDIARDSVFYDESGGGVTFSGGEPLSQPEFLMSLLDRCGEMDIHRVVDTSGYAPRRVLLKVAERTDLFLYDLKLAEERLYCHYIGGNAELVRENLRVLCETHVDIIVRVPVVPGITDSKESLAGLKSFLSGLPRDLPVQLLPYHSAAMDKYRRFGLAVPLPDSPEPTEEQMAMCRDLIER